jgi:hypothetical protein
MRKAAEAIPRTVKELDSHPPEKVYLGARFAVVITSKVLKLSCFPRRTFRSCTHKDQRHP